MILDGFDLIGSSNTGALTFRKEGHTIFFSPHLLTNDSNFVSVTSEVYTTNKFISSTCKFNCLEKTIKFVNNEIEKQYRK